MKGSWMRYSLLAVALVATSATAQDTTSAWNFYNNDVGGGTVGATVRAADGTQFALRCDKPGKKSVYAAVNTETKLGNPGPAPILRNVDYRFDDGKMQKGSWRYYENMAVAIYTSRGERSLVKLLEGVGDAKAMELQLDPVTGLDITVRFDITGVREAVKRVYESCGDDDPIKN
jgi:hypothetical protein